MMVTQIADTLSQPPPGAHLVQIYEDEEGLAEAVARYAAEGLRQDEAVIFIATKPHAEAFTRELIRSGVDLAGHQSSGQFIMLDADEMLAKFMVAGSPDRDRFESVIRGVIERAMNGTAHPRVRAYGEMVDLLWQAGMLEPALKLEEMWTSLMKTSPLTLLCGYGMKLLSSNFDGEAFTKACEAHSHAFIAQDRARLEGAVDRALDTVLGESRGNALRPLIDATLLPSSRVGRAESTVIWVRKNLPSKAEAILGCARRYYEEGAQA
jgi:hypothetical protein